MGRATRRCLVMLKAILVKSAVTYKILAVQKKTDSCISYSIIFGNCLDFRFLLKEDILL